MKAEARRSKTTQTNETKQNEMNEYKKRNEVKGSQTMKTNELERIEMSQRHHNGCKLISCIARRDRILLLSNYCGRYVVNLCWSMPSFLIFVLYAPIYPSIYPSVPSINLSSIHPSIQPSRHMFIKRTPKMTITSCPRFLH